MSGRAAAAPDAGFTLIESVIVMVVLGVLAGIVLMALTSLRTDAESTTSASNSKQCATAAALYQSKHGTPPNADDDLVVYFDGAQPDCFP